MWIQMASKLFEFIKKHYKGFLTGVGIVLLCLYVRACTAKHYAPKPVLPVNTKEQITVSGNKVTITTNKGTNTITGSRETKISVQKDGTIKITEKVYGWEHQVGFDGFISNGAGLGLDLRYFYYKRLDCMVGLGYMPGVKNMTAWVGLGFTPVTSWMSNTTFFVGYTVSKNPIAGVSLKF